MFLVFIGDKDNKNNVFLNFYGFLKFVECCYIIFYFIFIVALWFVVGFIIVIL